jgi:hypothetical protein
MLNEYVGRWFLLGCVVMSLAGCGKEVGRLPFSGEATAAPTLQLAAGDVGFWTDLDLKYEGPAALEYHIDLQQGGASVGSAVCDPLGQLNVKLKWVETHLGTASKVSGTGKMACSATLAKAGPTTVQTTLAFTTRPATFALMKADLIVKQ